MLKVWMAHERMLSGSSWNDEKVAVLCIQNRLRIKATTFKLMATIKRLWQPVSTLQHTGANTGEGSSGANKNQPWSSNSTHAASDHAAPTVTSSSPHCSGDTRSTEEGRKLRLMIMAMKVTKCPIFFDCTPADDAIAFSESRQFKKTIRSISSGLLVPMRL
jgi:hypothetical protein